MSTHATPQTARVAVLIDCDNISWQRAPAVMAEAATHGVVGVKRGYGDWGSPYLMRWREQLAGLAIQPIQQIAYVPGKGATDIALVIDAMDLLHSNQVDTFCLVASDSDYTRLAMRLREAGKRVVGIGAKQTPAAFSNACDRFTFVEVLGAGGATASESASSEDGVDADVSDSFVMAEQSTTAGDIPELQEMLESAVDARADDDSWALLSNVGFDLVANHPTFDSRNYGFARLGQLVREQDYLEVKDVPGPNGNRVTHVRRRHR